MTKKGNKQPQKDVKWRDKRSTGGVAALHYRAGECPLCADGLGAIIRRCGLRAVTAQTPGRCQTRRCTLTPGVGKHRDITIHVLLFISCKNTSSLSDRNFRARTQPRRAAHPTAAFFRTDPLLLQLTGIKNTKQEEKQNKKTHGHPVRVITERPVTESRSGFAPSRP